MKAYLFDLDGTLLDSMGVWDKVDLEFLERRGIPVPLDYAETIRAMSFQETAEYTIKRFNLPDSAENLKREWIEMAACAYSHVVPMKPYAKEFIFSLHECGAKIAAVTSLSPELHEPALKRHGIYHLFHVICTTDDASCGKSSPDIYLLAAKKLGVKPCDCIVFEDILVAIRSAKMAGMTVYGVYDSASKNDWEQIKKTADRAILDFKGADIY
ncbi:MAG: HAD family phosphatase [Treponema sp.]|nr:HAD family phosphatase [Treponema sp.]